MLLKIEKDNRKEVGNAVKQKILNALEICGGKAETYAKKECPVDTGALRNSITHLVDKDKQIAYVGTNMEYAPYVELGTGVNYEGGRKTSWTYQDAKGGWHITNGSKAQAFIKPAIANHEDEYQRILQDGMR